MANVVFRYSPDYVSTLAKWAPNAPGLVGKIAEFKRIKSENPVQPFGKKDIRMISDGPFGRTIDGIRHVHLTQDLSLFYTLSGSNPHVFNLYGIYSHNESGTGDSANVNVQKSLAKRMAGMEFSTNAGTAPAAEKPTANTFTAGAGSKVDYTPKPKAPTPAQAAQEKIRDPFFGFVKMVDEKWPERNFFKRMQDTKTLYDRIDVINQEAQYLMRIKQRNPLYPNQAEYMRGLEGLINYLKSQQKR